MKVYVNWLYAVFFLFVSQLIYSQSTGYREDQLYINVTYNKPVKLPKEIESTRLSYGFGLGYIRDIPIIKNGKKAIAIGIGYAYDQIHHGFENYKTNKNIYKLNAFGNFTIHSIEMPIQLRWRNSNLNRYEFWRAYIGMRLSYDIKNKDNYRHYNDDDNYTESNNKNVNILNKLRKGIEFSIGYKPVNLYINYSIDRLFKESYYKNKPIQTSILKLGIIFYFL